MRENGSPLTGKSANFDGFAVLRHPMIDSLNRLGCLLILLILFAGRTLPHPLTPYF